jgi:hypothetical protein
MLYGFECECGEEVDARRIALGYQTCLVCGDKEARARRFTVVPMHKSNYVAIFDRSDLLGINNKGGLVK